MFRLLTFLIWLAAPALHAGSAAGGSPAVAGAAEFQAAFADWDGERFAHAGSLFRQATVEEPDNPTNFYWLGVTEFHRMLQLLSRPGHATAAADAQEAAVQALTRAVKLDPHQSESHALLGTIYGMRIGEHWFRAVYLGLRVMAQEDAALADGATNPRVRYLLGTGEYYTAGRAADWRKALGTLLLAEQYFEAEAARPPAPLEPRWGRSSCRTFIGLTYEKLGDRARAADYFRRALAEHPADHLARAGLDRVAGANPEDHQP
jgi:tetratricopeptide (TPR) repeat protein